jgi:GNAT superfamily N-acetyltransferase
VIAEEISTEVTIQPVSYAAILDDQHAADLLRAYAEDCLVPDASPQRQLYAEMEKAGSIQCFAAYLNETLLVGFVSVIRTIVLHDGHFIAAIESIFVDPNHRSTGAGLLLLAAAERFSTDSGCRCLLASARIGSALDKILSQRDGYGKTHNQHTRWLNGYSGGRGCSKT